MEIKWIAVHKCVDHFRDDHDAYWYFKQVFDGADAFDLVECEEIAGGTDNNGVTVRTYRSAKGNEITLRIDGGFPVPELAVFDLTCGTVNETFIEELVAAFEQFHNSRFQYFLIKHDDGRSYCLDLYPNTDDERAGVSRYTQIKTNRCITCDGDLATSFKIEFVDGMGNHCDITAIKFKTSNRTNYILYRVKNEEKIGLFEKEAVALLKNDFQVCVSTMYYSEDVLCEPPWKVEHSFCAEGFQFKLVIDYESKCFFLENDSDSTECDIPDKLAACIVIKMLEIESNGTSDHNSGNPR